MRLENNINNSHGPFSWDHYTAPFGPRLLTSDNKPINYPNIKR